MIHDIPLERRTLHGHFSRPLPAILNGVKGVHAVLRDDASAT